MVFLPFSIPGEFPLGVERPLRRVQRLGRRDAADARRGDKTSCGRAEKHQRRGPDVGQRIERADADEERSDLLARHQLSARDALHLAVMARHRIRRILSFDTGFDGLPGVDRLTA